MSKAAPAIIAPIIAGLMFAAMGTTRGLDFDYSSAPEERQQRFLEGVARDFERNSRSTFGKSAIIEHISADAQTDAITIEARFKDALVEMATDDQIAELQDFIYARNCGYFTEESLFGKGITLKVRMKRPGGKALASVNADDEGCANFNSPAQSSG